MSDPDSSSEDEEPPSLIRKREMIEKFDSLICDWKSNIELFKQYIPENCKIFN